MSGLLYTIYTNEVPELHKIMDNENKFMQITKTSLPKFPFKNAHAVINFVDDSNNIISFKKSEGIKSYLEHYFLLIQTFYNSNLLKINADKTCLMFVGKKKLLDEVKNLEFQADVHKIRQKTSIKILGSILTPNLDNERDIAQMVPILNNRLNQLEKIMVFR